jgi:cytidylate kinase
MGEEASRLSRFPEVREILVEKQRELARNGSVVMEGRDIGSVVLPQADLKIFLDADEEERIARRLLQWRGKGVEASAEELKQEIRGRDLRDRTRKEAPLTLPSGGIRVDTTGKSIEEVEKEILSLLKEEIP